MKRILVSLFFGILLLAGCSGDGSSRVEVTVSDLGTQSLTLLYYQHGVLTELPATAVDSRFSFEAKLDETAIVEVMNNRNVRMGVFVVEPGEQVEIKLQSGDPYFVESDDELTSQALGEFLAANKANLNDAIARQVSAEPSSLLSGILMAYWYDCTNDAARADSLFSQLDYSKLPDGVIEGRQEIMSRVVKEVETVDTLRLMAPRDSVVNFLPRSSKPTLYLLSSERNMPDSIREALNDTVIKRYRVAYLRLTTDTFGWHTEVKKYPKGVKHFWVPGADANPSLQPLKINTLPLYMLTDTAGTIIYRGASLPDALKAE